MILFVIRRLLLIIPVLLGLLLLTFVMLRLVPGDPAAAIAGDAATPEQIAQIRAELNLDEPFVVQFADYAWNAAQGDFGVSAYSGRPVGRDIAQRLPATLELTFVALIIAAVGGVTLGALAGAWRNSPFDHITRILTVIGLATASFWLAIMLQLVFALDWGILPLRGRLPSDVPMPPGVTGVVLIDSLLAGRFDIFHSALTYITLPAITIAFGGLATLARFTRSSVVDAMNSEYAAYETAAGYPRRRVLFPYALKNALVTPVTQIGLLFGAFVSNAVAVEAVFDWPGLGSYLVNAIYTNDYPAVLAVTLAIGLVYALINILVDVVHGLIDPRIAERL